MNQIKIIEGVFDTGELANLQGTGLLQREKTLHWRFDGKEYDLRDAVTLKRQMERYKGAADYAKAKLFNRILTQLDYVDQNTAVDHFPEMLQIEHAEVCNARCIMCNHYFTRNHGCRFMDMEIIRQLERILPYVQTAGLNGIGEPLLHPEIMRLMEIYEKYGVRLTTNTNLSVMDPELAAIMHRTFQDIQISCDACDAVTYEKIRGGLKFDTFVKNARMLRQAGDTEICMATVVMRQNLTQLPKIVEFAAELGCDKLIMLDLNASTLLGNTQDCVKNYPKTAGYYMEKAKETAEKKHIFLHTLDYVEHIKSDLTEEEERVRMEAMDRFPEDGREAELYELYRKMDYFNPLYDALETDYCTPSSYRTKGYCLFIENRPFISAGGDMFNCCSRRMHSMGNLKEQSFADVWNGEAMRRMRRIQLDGYLPRYCVGCAYLRGNLMEDRIQVYDKKAEQQADPYDLLRMRIIKEKVGAL